MAPASHVPQRLLGRKDELVVGAVLLDGRGRGRGRGGTAFGASGDAALQVFFFFFFLVVFRQHFADSVRRLGAGDQKGDNCGKIAAVKDDQKGSAEARKRGGKKISLPPRIGRTKRGSSFSFSLSL